ncbi:TetR/AcrR family transcriptional regulator [Maricaulis salignorans]|uniref:DNA-binding transcriptional regulator, AcrR family n=1 Tax=Maricaulis salignorans TaxID=144026 RepID=A0A1G9PH12_9PROT|nr:TetR/AcrR family transcriptional regulator [Maricaulis salignorans]SDL97761.1 DNA-binding transcriptional regulator, AcrR family [Maricaulis salignorans]
MPKPSHLPLPKQARARATYRALMLAAAEQLAEGGLEALTTNGIVARAGLSPPAFYRYFQDKFDILQRLARELMQAQNDQIAPILQSQRLDLPALIALLRATVDVTRSYPGGAALLRAMRADPQLQAIRLKSHRGVASGLARQLNGLNLDLSDEAAYRRARLAVEIGYAAVELIFEDPPDSEADILKQTARAILAFADSPES